MGDKNNKYKPCFKCITVTVLLQGKHRHSHELALQGLAPRGLQILRGFSHFTLKIFSTHLCKDVLTRSKKRAWQIEKMRE